MMSYHDLRAIAIVEQYGHLTRQLEDFDVVVETVTYPPPPVPILEPELADYLDRTAPGYQLGWRDVQSTFDMDTRLCEITGASTSMVEALRHIERAPVIVFRHERDLVAWKLRP